MFENVFMFARLRDMLDHSLVLFYDNIQVTLVRGLAQLFLVEMVFLNYQQTIYLYNFKKEKKHTLAGSFC
jgi:hypothetical protein